MRTTAPETMQPAEMTELMAMPVRPGSPKTNLAGGYCRGRVRMGQALSYRLKIGRNRGHVHVGVEVGLERAHVAPVERVLLVLVDEVVGGHLVAAQNAGQDVVAEVVLGVGIFGVLHQLRQQHVGVEEVNAHGGVDHGRD